MKNLFNRNFVMVILGQLISIFGNSVLRFALPLYVLDKTGSVTLFGSTLAISTIPTILFSPFGGILADRANKRNLMVILDFITAIIIVSFSFFLISGPVVVLITLLMVIFSIIQSFYQPVVQASIPVIISKENLEQANGIVSLVNALSNLLGPILAGILYGIFGIWIVMMTGAICFFFAAVMEMFIKISFEKQTQHQHVFELIKSDFKMSFNFVTKENPIILKVMFVASGMNLLMTSMILIGLPTMIKVKLALSSQLYGITQGVMAAGMIAGGILISVIGKKVKTHKAYLLLVYASIALVPIGLAFNKLLSSMTTYWIITLSCYVMMAAITMFSITMISFVQRETPNHLIGKVISFILVLTQCTLPIGQVLYGFIFEVMADSISIIVFMTALCSITIAVYSRKIFKGFVKEDNVCVETCLKVL